MAAQSEARLLQHNYIGTEHLLLGLLDDGETLAMRALQASGISQQAAREKILAIIGHGQEEAAAGAGHIPFTPRSKKVLELSLREATAQDQIYIGTEHVLLALLREGRGLACQVLHELGADTPGLRHQIQVLSGHRQVPDVVTVPPPGITSTTADTPGLRHQIQVLSGHRQVPDVVTVPPPGIHDYDVRIAQARQDKDAAIDAGEHERAAAARGSEKELLAERDRLIADWVAGVDVANLGRELDRLRDEVRPAPGTAAAARHRTPGTRPANGRRDRRPSSGRALPHAAHPHAAHPCPASYSSVLGVLVMAVSRARILARSWGTVSCRFPAPAIWSNSSPST